MCTSGTKTEDRSATSDERLLLHRQDLLKMLSDGGKDLYLVNVAERDEPSASTSLVAGAAPVLIPLGQLIRDCTTEEFVARTKGKRIVTYCPKGSRSLIAARELSSRGFAAQALAGGLAAWENPAAASFECLGVYGHRPDSKLGVEKLSLALGFVLNAVRTGDHAALMLMSEGVFAAVRDHQAGGLKGDEHAGDPFLPVAKLLEAFVKEGGLVFVCHSCVVANKVSYEGLHSWVHRGSTPDVGRWLKSAKSSLQFL